MLTVESPQKALEYFDSMLEFTTESGDLHEMIKNNEVNVVDVREEKDYKKSHIPGAINIPQDKWSDCRGLVHDKPNVVYCYNMLCYLAPKACREFARCGYPVMMLLGGFKGWERSRLPVEV